VNVIELSKGFSEEDVAVLPTAPSTGPIHMIHQALGVPMAAFSIRNANSRDHGGDENVSLADYYTHIELIKELIASYE
ncbi:MAG: peptidase M20, partial [Streptococcus sp.]|nr:peptidase M20 [Streptococcus sp.]